MGTGLGRALLGTASLKVGKQEPGDPSSSTVWLLPALNHPEGVTAGLCHSVETWMESAWPLQPPIILVPQFPWCNARALSLIFFRKMEEK